MFQPQFGYSGMLYFTGGCSAFGLFLLLFILSENSYEFEEKYLLEDNNFGPVI
jgi:hypothetical protein